MTRLFPRLGSFRIRPRTNAGESSNATGKASKGKEKVTQEEAGPSGSRAGKAISDKEGNSSSRQYMATPPEKQRAESPDQRQAKLEEKGEVSLRKLLATPPKTLEEREAELKEKGEVSLRKLLATARDEETAKPLPNSHSVARAEEAAERLNTIFAIPPRTDTSRAWNYTNTKQTLPSIPEDRAINIPVEELPRHTDLFWGTGATSSSGPQLSRSKSGRPENLGPISEIESVNEPAPRLMRSTGSRRPTLGTDSHTGPSNEPSPEKPRSASKLGQWMQRLTGKKTRRTES